MIRQDASTGMSRTSFRNVCLLLFALTVGLALLIFNQGRGAQSDIMRKTNQMRELSRELDNAARRSAALKELDQLTISEQNATRLDILRHLGLEQNDYQFIVNARQTRVVVDASLYLRVVRLQADIPYAQALGLLDRLHETRKMVVNMVEIARSSKPGDMVQLVLEGTIYGLDKHNE